MSTPIKHKIPHLGPKNIREFIIDFTALLGEINPDMHKGRWGLKGLFLPLFSLFGGSR